MTRRWKTTSMRTGVRLWFKDPGDKDWTRAGVFTNEEAAQRQIDSEQGALV